MDFTKFFTKVSNRRPANMLRKWAARYFETPNAITLANGMPNVETFPFEEISISYKSGKKTNLIGRDLASALQYGPSQGFPPLVKRIREFQEKYHKPKNNSWDVVFTTGSQDGCSKIFELIIEEGDPVMMQMPVYIGIISAITPLAPELLEIYQDADGIIPEEIENICEKRLKEKKPMPKLLYVNPTGANPTGTVLPESRRKRIYELAQKYNFLIMEDDPYFFVQFLKERPRSFLSLDDDGRVLRLDSFSKILSSGLRLGIVTAHKDVVQKLIRHIEGSILHTSSMSQMLVYKFFESWTPEELDDHFNNVRNFYLAKRDMMQAAVSKHLSGLAEWTIPKGGMFFWVKVTGLDDVYELADRKCVEQKIFVLPGHPFNYVNDKPDSHLRLSYSYATTEEVDKALGILAKLIREELASRGRL